MSNHIALSAFSWHCRFMDERPQYLSQQLITYIGNKRSLLPFIGEAIAVVKEGLGKGGTEKISSFDVFSGSGIVSRYLKQHSSLLIANDMEEYARVINTCYLSNAREADTDRLREAYKYVANSLEYALSSGTGTRGFISELYAPKSEGDIQQGERVFYTPQNALILDTARSIIDTIDADLRPLLIAPLLSEASIHANTSGVFKGFYKDKSTKVGTYGGSGKNALLRIMGAIRLNYPLFSAFETESRILTGDSNEVCLSCPEVDLAYLDPPYNQHPYGSNYFMLNLIAAYERPGEISSVSGIPVDWNRSSYNKKREALASLETLVCRLKAKYIVVSFNSEGFITMREMVDLLSRYGTVETREKRYNAFRGSRNLSQRSIHTTEFLFILKRS